MECMRIWVYGSLMEGFFNYEKALVGKVVSRARSRVKGSVFHQLDKGYPALVPGEGWVYGELLELADFNGTLPVLDEIEEYYGPGDRRNEYDRLLTPVFLCESEKWTEAHVYWYGRKDLGTQENPAVPVPSGDWRTFMEMLPR
ncbi:MAG: gamma-glutamylcyclotransferase family protein [Sphaerochaetaceae bacterium]|jgi:gamma-glutamylcyclotransferase (GGCT)/AIG2-like uncharacterized protein YtfP